MPMWGAHVGSWGSVLPSSVTPLSLVHALPLSSPGAAILLQHSCLWPLLGTSVP